MSDDIFSALGLSFNPFSSSACTKGYFQTGETRRILEELYYGITNRKGFMVLVGEVGVGKTSLLYQLLDRLAPDKVATSWVFNTLLERQELFRAIVKDFGLTVPKDAGMAELVDTLHHHFLDQYAKGSTCAIIIDEAHNLSQSSLEALRMLSNLETDSQKLVQILLVAQPELKVMLEQTNLRQLRSRISIYLEMGPLSREDVGRYVTFKLSSAGTEIPVDEAAVRMLWKGTGGNSRLVNLVMERALYAIVVLGGDSLSAKMMQEALKEIASYQTDVKERITRGRRRLTALGAAACVALVLGLVFLPLFEGRGGVSVSLARLALQKSFTPGPVQAASAQSGPTPAASAQAAPSEQPAQAARQEAKQVAALSSQPTANPAAHASALAASPAAPTPGTILPAYETFLSVFKLEDAAQALADAVAQRDLAQFEDALPEGYSLLAMDRTPPDAEILYAALPWKDYAGVGPEWIVLWQPIVTITDFFYTHKSKDIEVLQRMLKTLGYYKGRIDGEVGSLTWRAVNRFQERYGLPKSGTADPQTVFWIYARYSSKMNAG